VKPQTNNIRGPEDHGIFKRQKGGGLKMHNNLSSLFLRFSSPEPDTGLA
jgi:hypothetical protein